MTSWEEIDEVASEEVIVDLVGLLDMLKNKKELYLENNKKI